MMRRVVDVLINIIGWICCLALVGLWRHVLLRWLGQSRRRTAVVFLCLLLLLAAGGTLPAWYVLSSWSSGTPMSSLQLRLTLYAFGVQLVAGCLMYRSTRHAVETLGDQQGGRPFPVQCRGHDERGREILVRRLSSADLKPHERLYLNPTTVFAGIDSLQKQVSDYAPQLRPDLCIGINNGGTVIAACLAELLHKGDRHLVTITTEGEDHQVIEPIFPLPLIGRASHIPTILIADLEVKRGKSLRHVIEYLRKRYDPDKTNKLTIKVATLVAAAVDKPISDLTDLLVSRGGPFQEPPEYLPDFVAFVCPYKVGIVN